MGYKKIANLIDDASNKPSKFRKKTVLKEMMNQEKHTMLIVKSNSKLQC